jgi:hypothetical protein
LSTNSWSYSPLDDHATCPAPARRRCRGDADQCPGRPRRLAAPVVNPRPASFLRLSDAVQVDRRRVGGRVGAPHHDWSACSTSANVQSHTPQVGR